MHRKTWILFTVFLLHSGLCFGHGGVFHKGHGNGLETQQQSSGGRDAYEPPTANGVVRPGGYQAYEPPTSNGVVRPGRYDAYEPPTSNGVVRPGGFEAYDPPTANGVVRP